MELHTAALQALSPPVEHHQPHSRQRCLQIGIKYVGHKKIATITFVTGIATVEQIW